MNKDKYVFAQLVEFLDAHRSKCYRLGMGKTYRNHHSLGLIKIVSLRFSQMQLSFLRLLSPNSTRIAGR